jgi:transcriptional regulator with XRE-family HTH domain
MVVKLIGRCLLGEILVKNRMSQEDLSVKVDMNKGQINEYIRNKRVMTLNSARVIASALNCRIEDLYEWLD